MNSPVAPESSSAEVYTVDREVQEVSSTFRFNAVDGLVLPILLGRRGRGIEEWGVTGLALPIFLSV